MKDNDIEYILCAANYYNDGKIYTYSPVNIEVGFVICGHRHHNCISSFVQLVGFPYTEDGHRLHNTEIQGFLTNKNRFVDRLEGARIAILAEQIDDVFKKKLYSEDLY